jgi:outer membrane protein TolC
MLGVAGRGDLMEARRIPGLPFLPGLLRVSLFLVFLLAPLAAAGGTDRAGEEERERPTVRVGVLADGPLETEERILGLVPRAQILELIRREVVTLTAADFDLRFPDELRRAGDWHVAGVRSGLESLLEDPEVDMVLALGAISTAVACRRTELAKPVFAPVAVDVEAQDLPFTRGTSGVRNLNYTTLPASIAEDLRRFRELVPFTRLHVLVDPLVPEAMPELLGYFAELGGQMGIESMVPVFVVDSHDEALAALPEDAEAVYVTPSPRMPVGEVDRLVAGLTERRLPSFALLGRPFVERGVLAGHTLESDIQRMARRVALNMQRTLLGEDPGTLPVLVEGGRRLTINMRTARALGWYPRWKILLEAELLHEEPEEDGARLSLVETIEEARRINLDIRAGESRVAAGAEEVPRARSVLLPQLDAAARGLAIDADRAATSFGTQPERSVGGGVSLSQVLYSDQALANLRVQKLLQERRVAEQEVLALEVGRDAARAFLNVLRAQTARRIRRENLRLIETNLQIARRRQVLGVSGPADVYRWESALATARREVIAAGALVDTTRAALNRILDRPQESFFVALDPSLEQYGMNPGTGRIEEYVGNPWAFDVFRDFNVGEAVRRAPELRALDEAIAAQERVALAARRSFWAPAVVFRGDWSALATKSGEGTEPPPILSFQPGAVERDDEDWSLALTVSLPLYAGGERRAVYRQSREELRGLELERQSLAERIEQRARSALFATRASFPAMELSREAAEAARKNFELVREYYSQGLVSIVELIDAQTAALVAEQDAENAVYDFLLDFVEALRATANLDVLVSEEAREAWYLRIGAFFARVGGP